MRITPLFAISLAWLLAFIPPVAAQSYPPRDSHEAQLESALQEIGVQRSALGLDPLELRHFGGDRFRTWEFDFLSRRPGSFPAHSEETAADLLDEEVDAPRLARFVHSRQGVEVRLGLIEDPLEEFRSALSDTPYPLKYTKEQLEFADWTDPQHVAWADYPDEVRRATEIFLLAVDRAWNYHELALGDLEPSRLRELAEKSLAPDGAESLSPAEEIELERSYAQFDFRMANTGATLVAIAADNLRSTLRSHREELQSAGGLAIETPYGLVVFEGEGEMAGPEWLEYSGVWPPSPAHLTLLRVVLPSSADAAENLAQRHTRCTVDWSVNQELDFTSDPRKNFAFVHIGVDARADTYTSGYTGPQPGISIILDHGGDDRYLSKESSPGHAAGIFGTSLVVDRGGDDSWDADRLAQGAGLFGFGAVADLGGNDSYRAYQYAQGFGYVGGAGVLFDKSGDDTYTARDDRVEYPSAQSEQHNASLSQGFGYGKRADYTNGHSLAGGVGTLIDGGGDDEYTAGIFAQGAGYWYGVGTLHDAAGDDSYLGQWYVQGAGAHFAFGGLYDGGGDDSYEAPMNMALGAGHDLSVGVVYEGGGDDDYDAPSLSLGASNARGVGLFWDAAGNDTYRADQRTTFGEVSAWEDGGIRRYFRATGIFLDLAGTDTYPGTEPFSHLENKSSWEAGGGSSGSGEIARGLDR